MPPSFPLNGTPGLLHDVADPKLAPRKVELAEKLKKQMEEMQRRLARLSDKDKPA